MNLGEVAWKLEKDPYKIWLREIIMQQTRMEQGLPYYFRFLECYPNLGALARANDDEVFRLWQGLGYYNRCRNLLFTARIIEKEYKGCFPEQYDEILSLKGVGRYTAAAIASFAFQLPYAVVDGNVIRVLSRFFASKQNGKSSTGQKWFEQKAQELLPQYAPGPFNQAMMDLGSSICTPLSPKCGACPISADCKAYQLDKVGYFPLRVKKKPLKHRHFHFLLPSKGPYIYIEKRNQKDIWHSLHTPCMTETENGDLPSIWKQWGIEQIRLIESDSQVLSHQKIHGYFYTINSKEPFISTEMNLMKVHKTRLDSFAFPRLVISFFKKNDYL